MDISSLSELEGESVEGADELLVEWRPLFSGSGHLPNPQPILQRIRLPLPTWEGVEGYVGFCGFAVSEGYLDQLGLSVAFFLL